MKGLTIFDTLGKTKIKGREFQNDQRRAGKLKRVRRWRNKEARRMRRIQRA